MNCNNLRPDDIVFMIDLSGFYSESIRRILTYMMAYEPERERRISHHALREMLKRHFLRNALSWLGNEVHYKSYVSCFSYYFIRQKFFRQKFISCH